MEIEHCNIESFRGEDGGLAGGEKWHNMHPIACYGPTSSGQHNNRQTRIFLHEFDTFLRTPFLGSKTCKVFQPREPGMEKLAIPALKSARISLVNLKD